MLPPHTYLCYQADTSDFIIPASTNPNINLTIKFPLVSCLLAKELCNTWIGFYDPKFYAKATSSPSIALGSRKILRLLATIYVVVCFAFPIDANLLPNNWPGWLVGL